MAKQSEAVLAASGVQGGARAEDVAVLQRGARRLEHRPSNQATRKAERMAIGR